MIKIPVGKKLAWLYTYHLDTLAFRQLVLIPENFQEGDDVYSDAIDFCVGSNQTIREIYPSDDISGLLLWEVEDIGAKLKEKV
jgi:hypothetical protein